MPEITFGKHKGRSFQDVLDADPSYCQWVLTQEKPSGQLMAFLDFVRASGKYSGVEASSSASSRGPSIKLPETQPTPGGLMLACELMPKGRFWVRAEKSAIGSTPVAEAYLHSSVWEGISQIQGAKSAKASGRTGGWTFPLEDYNRVVLELLRFVDHVEHIPDWVLALVRRRAADSMHIVAEEKLPEGLLPYQREGVQFGVSHGGRCLIGDEMGLGKTLQALAIATQYREDWPVLIVCPSSLRWVWKEQIEQWLPDCAEEGVVEVIRKGKDVWSPFAKFSIISYAMLANDSKSGAGHFQTRLDGTPFQFVIVDESHNIKDWSAERTRVIVSISRKANRCVLLSGTPTRNSADELHAQLSALLPHFRCTMADFRARYCVLKDRQLFGGRIIQSVVGSKNTLELNYVLTSTVMVRRMKKDVIAELPEKRRQKVPLEITEGKSLKSLRTQSKSLYDGRGGDFISIDDRGAESLFLSTAKAKLPAVKEYITDVLERCNEKFIIFAHHKFMLDALSELLLKALSKEELTYVRVDGSTPAQRRPEMVRSFQTDDKCRVALLSITACSEGLTLTAASLVIFAELHWVPGTIEQAEARAHRIGSNYSKVVVEYLVVPGTGDEIVYATLERKKKDTSRVLDGAEETLGANECELATASLKKRRLEAAFAAACGAADEGETKRRKVPGTPAGRETPERAPTPAAVIPDGHTPPPVTRASNMDAKVEFLLRAAMGGKK